MLTRLPAGVSSLFFAFADLVIHSIFNTSHEKSGYVNNNVSSYLDLSPLYGSSVEEQLRVRKSDGTGALWEDCFADSRLLFMPPSSGALLVLLNRNHNVMPVILIPDWSRFTHTSHSTLLRRSSPSMKTEHSKTLRLPTKPLARTRTRRSSSVRV